MTKKQANGEGSVYRRKDGRVVGEWVDANGKTRYMTSMTMSKAEMKTAIRKKLQERDEGIVHDSEGLTVATIKVVSEMAGHADVSITLSVYGHVLPDMQGTAADSVDEALG